MEQPDDMRRMRAGQSRVPNDVRPVLGPVVREDAARDEDARLAKQAGPARGDQGDEHEFWQHASYLAACAPKRSWRTYELLKSLYDGRFPAASSAKRDAAMTRLTALVWV